MFLGLDVGGSSLKAGVFSKEFNILKQYSESYSEIAKTGDFPDFLISKIFELFDDSKKNFPSLISAGIGVPGVVTSEGTIVAAPNLTGIINFPILKILKEKIDIPLSIDNDANAAALAELHFGSGKNLNDFIYVTLGTGIGGTIISKREIFRGSSGGAGEIGHTIIRNGHKEYDSRSYREGVVEVYAGREGILRLANESVTKYHDSKLIKIKNFDVSDISVLADSGDNHSRYILSETGDLIAAALATAANILDIPYFIIGGGISQSDFLINEIEIKLKQKSIPSISNRIFVDKAKYKKDTGITGAATLAMLNQK